MHMTGDHHGQTAGTATRLVRAVDGILGTYRDWCGWEVRASAGAWQASPFQWRSGQICPRVILPLLLIKEFIETF